MMASEYSHAEQVAANMLGDDGPENLPVELRARLRRIRDLVGFVGGAGHDLRSTQVIATIVEQWGRESECPAAPSEGV